MSRPNFSKFTDDELLQVAKVKIAKANKTLYELL